jgi:hypothetical protein
MFGMNFFSKKEDVKNSVMALSRIDSNTGKSGKAYITTDQKNGSLPSERIINKRKPVSRGFF